MPREYDALQDHASSGGRSLSIGNASDRRNLARESIARDIEEDLGDGSSNFYALAAGIEGAQPISSQPRRPSQFSILGSYHRHDIGAIGQSRATVFPSLDGPVAGSLTEAERAEALSEERSLLKDNKLIPRRKAKDKRSTPGEQAKQILSTVNDAVGGQNTSVGGSGDLSAQIDASAVVATESTPLIAENLHLPYGGEDDSDLIDQKWEEAVRDGKIKTTWRRESLVLWRYSRALVLTFVLQYSLPTASVFAVGHLGKTELGAVSLASMTANITGYAIYQGLATSLDTLCSQAYGSGRKTLVGLQFQRMVYFLWICTIPIAALWIASPIILQTIVPEKETARLAGLYLRIVLLGAPAYAVFESAKRFVQAQGRFAATTAVLLVVAPLNILFHWVFVFKFRWGFVGAPIAVALTENLLPLFLYLHIAIFGGFECWGGFSRAAFRNWTPMIKLAVPGLVMVFAEYLAFEVLTLSTSYIGEAELAAQSILTTITTLTWNVPYPIGVAASTRIANLIGATLSDAGKVAAKAALCIAVGVGLFNSILLVSLREFIPRLFTEDQEVSDIVTKVLPLCAAFQLFDALTANCNGVLRGIGRQKIGMVSNVAMYYAVGMPVSFGLGFGLNLGLIGLWSGVALALALVAMVEGYFIFIADWERAVDEAKFRNATA